MPPSDSRKRPSAAAIDRARKWLLREQAVADGALPTVNELLSGLKPLGGDWQRDATAWARSMLAHSELSDPAVREALELLAAAFALGPIRKCLEAFKTWHDESGFDRFEGSADAEDRLRIYAVALGEIDDSWTRWQLQLGRNSPSGTATVLGMIWRRSRLGSAAATPDDWLAEGHTMMRTAVRSIEDENKALDAVSDGTAATLNEDDETPELPDLVDEDRAEFHTGGALTRLRDGLRRRVIIVPPAPAGLTGARGAIWKSFEGVAGRSLPIVERGDPASHMISLSLEFPHCRPEIATILRDLATAEVAHIRPTLLIGSPGCGKTSLARAIAKTIGLPSTIYSCAGMADSSAMGTSAQWHSARPSLPLDLIRTSRVANPLVVLDEIDKTDEGRNNGSLVDALLAFLEPSTSRSHRDLALEADVDLSRVSWIATANEIRDVPAPLRDRMRVVRIPDPTWQHISDLSRVIIEDIARERQIDPRWLDDLAQDELDVIKKAWPGGSLRRLRRAIEVIVDGRDAIMGRA